MTGEPFNRGGFARIESVTGVGLGSGARKQLELRGASALDNIIDCLFMPVLDQFVALDGRKDERVAESMLDQLLDSG